MDDATPGRDRGKLAAAISNAILGIHSEHYGRGASRARTVMGADYVICFLEDIYTPVEKTLIDAGRFAAVKETRSAFQDTMETKFSEAVEEVVDRARHRVDVARRAGDGLRQHGAAEIEHAGRQIAGLASRRREAGADQRQRLLLDDRDQAVPHELQANGGERIVDAHDAAFSNRMAPIGLIRAAKLLGTMVVVSSSAMTAGPGTRLPIVRSSRW